MDIEVKYNSKTAYNKRARLQAIIAYGGCCSCCGETNADFLCLDHINNDGAEERRQPGGSGYTLPARLRREGYPKGRYQVLCYNCNMAKGLKEACPCSTKRLTAVAALLLFFPEATYLDIITAANAV